MKALLLAAGYGKRLRPLTDEIPKPLLKVAEIPIIERIILALKSGGISEIGVITGHLADQLEAYLSNGERWNIPIRCFRQPVYNGTGHAVLPAESFLGNESFFLGYGDILTDPRNYKRILDEARAYPRDSILGVWPVEDPSMGGVVVLEGDRLIGLVEKPPRDRAPSNLINAGLMVLQPEILDCIHQLKLSERNEYELTDAILSLTQQSIVRVCQLIAFWSDIGTVEKLEEADRIWKQQNFVTDANFRHEEP